MIVSLTPSDLGLPPKFQTWRPGQWAAIETSVTTDKRFVACSMPTGSGKSPMAVSSAILTGGRSVYLTATKSLQDQLTNDFASRGMFDMRGRNNYHCAKGVNLSCAEGHILDCKYADCGYAQDRREFIASDMGLTNYAYYFSSVMHSEGVGDIDLLILDEAHSSIQELSSALEISLDHFKLDFLYDRFSSPPFNRPLAQWRTWAQFLLPKAKSYLSEIKTSGASREPFGWMSTVHRFIITLTQIAGAPEDWILDESRASETLICPLWPTDYANQYLFRDIQHILLVSATLVPKTLSLLGVPENQVLFLSSDHTFDSRRCPVYLFGPCRVDHKMSDGNIEEWIGRMDTIINKRLDRKGIIHTVSYKNQQLILSKSIHRPIMIAPESSREFNSSLAEFRHSPPPRILISPAATTGYDFPGDQAEYQILAKVPFIDARSPVMAARATADPEYLPYLVAQTLVQTCGRAMRGKDDRVENFILDAHANWFFRSKEKGGYRHLFPSWFLRQLVYPDGLPSPKPKL